MQWLKHAFAVDTREIAEPTEAERRVVDAVCRQVVRRHLTTPALITLEMLRPLNFLIAQGMHVAMPMLSVVMETGGPRQFAHFLEQRGSVEHLCRRIEELEAEASRREREAAAALGEAADQRGSSCGDGAPGDSAQRG